MEIFYSLRQIRKFNKPVVTLGVFDGVHLGHRRILEEVVRKAKNIRGRSILITFTPHPQKEGHLYSLEHRLRLIAELGLDVCIVIKFNRRFSQISANDFIKNILAARLGAHYIYVGKNFRFGRNAKGNFRVLKKLSKTCNFKLKVFDVIKKGHQPICSTYIRKLITRGDLKKAETLLSRPVCVLGTVIRGSSLARRLGFPTANINPHHEVLPPSGVYVVKIIFNHKKLNGICYIGTKPTFKVQSSKFSPLRSGIPQNAGKVQSSKHIEVSIFNFNKNIYGKYLEIYFIKKMREEQKFASVQFLAEQVKKDIFYAKGYFSRHH